MLLAASETSSTVTLAAAVEAAGLDLAALEAAELAHLVTLDGHRVEFVHPLLRSVIYQRATSAERRGAHRVLADTAAVGEDDRRALHLGRAAAGRDEHIARGIEGAALAARERGGTSASARAFEAAANLTPAPEERARRRIEAARDHQLVGNSETSTALLQQAIAETTDAVLRADAELLQARAQAWRGETGRAFETLRLQALGVEAADPARAAALLTDAAVIATIRGQYRTQVMTARAAVSAAERAGTSAVVAAEIVLAHGLANVGRGDEAQQLLRRRGSDLGSGDPLAGSALLQLAGFAWMCLGNDVRARRFLDRAIGSLRDAGALGALPFVLASRSMLDHRTGRWRNAVADAGESVALAEQVGHEAERPFYLVCLAAIEATRGNDRECREHLATAEALCERFEVDSVLPWMEAARGSLELGQGRYEEAVGALERIPALAERLAIGEPSLVLWQPDLIEAYVRTGRLDGAARVLGELERQAEATGRVWAQATAARCRGLLADDTDVEEHFEAALAWHEQLSAPFELARTQLCLGERLGMRRRPLDARRSLAAATDTFQRLGADPWARRARRELARNGGSPGPPADPGLAQLTPQEVQVALAVAEGASNKEVAAALFLSTKTIEFHLGNTYRKLGLRSRTQLARLISH